jgi:hypothetical protein
MFGAVSDFQLAHSGAGGVITYEECYNSIYASNYCRDLVRLDHLLRTFACPRRARSALLGAAVPYVDFLTASHNLTRVSAQRPDMRDGNVPFYIILLYFLW